MINSFNGLHNYFKKIERKEGNNIYSSFCQSDIELSRYETKVKKTVKMSTLDFDFLKQKFSKGEVEKN